ncbi:hypothetical protein ACFLU8_03890 [Chloroflexota bacterium]
MARYEVGRPPIRISLELLRRLRRAGLCWCTISRRYYSQTKHDINWMTLKRRYEAELALQEANNGDHGGQAQ